MSDDPINPENAYLPKNPGDPLYAQDWNAMQARIREAIAKHDHGTVGASIDGQALKDGTVAEGKIKNDAVTETKIRNGAVTTNKIGSKAVKTGHLDNLAVGTDHIQNGAVTDTKIRASAIKPDHIDNGSIPTGKLASERVTFSGMSFPGIDALHTSPGEPTPYSVYNFDKGIRIGGPGDVREIPMGGRAASLMFPTGIGPGGLVAIQSRNSNHKLMTLKDDDSVKAEVSLTSKSHWALLMLSTREAKENIAPLASDEALAALEQLEPVKYDYIDAKAFRPNLGFIAEEMPDCLSSEDRRSLSPFEVIPILTRVAKEQQKTIETLRGMVETLMERLDGMAPGPGPSKAG